MLYCRYLSHVLEIIAYLLKQYYRSAAFSGTNSSSDSAHTRTALLDLNQVSKCMGTLELLMMNSSVVLSEPMKQNMKSLQRRLFDLYTFTVLLPSQKQRNSRSARLNIVASGESNISQNGKRKLLAADILAL